MTMFKIEFHKIGTRNWKTNFTKSEQESGKRNTEQRAGRTTEREGEKELTGNREGRTAMRGKKEPPICLVLVATRGKSDEREERR